MRLTMFKIVTHLLSLIFRVSILGVLMVTTYVLIHLVRTPDFGWWDAAFIILTAGVSWVLCVALYAIAEGVDQGREEVERKSHRP